MQNEQELRALKTIREIAEEIGVSKQAVYKRYKGKLYRAVFPFARLANGTIYILEQGERILKQDFFNDGAYGGVHTEHVQGTSFLMLQEELKKINRQLTELATVIKTQSKSANKLKKKGGNQMARKIKSVPIKRLISK